MTRQRLAVGLLLVSIFAIRAIQPDQPIVENYVGRQIPTAMVARNLERGSGFLRPQLDTGPIPNLFLVEPPIYAQVVALVRPIFRLPLSTMGRLVSAGALTLGGWGLYGLVRRREGETVAWLALASFGLFPVMIRYGRAFQPDALMVGCLLAGLRGWDEFEANGNVRWAGLGGIVLATGLALKITSGWALLPFFLIVRRWPIGWRLAVSLLMLVPALSWYLVAWSDLSSSGMESLASSDNARIWWKALAPGAWLIPSTSANILRGLVIRAFTPIGFGLAVYGLTMAGKVDRIWVGWAIGSTVSIVGLASKWHHAYYWMVVAPLAAVGLGRGLSRLRRISRYGPPVSLGLASLFLGFCVVQSISTFETPAEWASLEVATRRLELLDSGSIDLAASEAVLFFADRQGYRLELNPDAMKRAAGEWGLTLNETADPLALVEMYVSLFQLNGYGFVPKVSTVEELQKVRSRTPRDPGRQPLIVADVGSIDREPRRRAWREAIRNRPETKILADQPGYLIAELR